MKAVVVVVLVILVFSTTSPQPTSDFNDIGECGCQEEIEMLRSQMMLLKNQVDSIISKDATPAPSPVPRS